MIRRQFSIKWRTVIFISFSSWWRKIAKSVLCQAPNKSSYTCTQTALLLFHFVFSSDSFLTAGFLLFPWSGGTGCEWTANINWLRKEKIKLIHALMENSLYRSGKCLCHSHDCIVLDKMVEQAEGMQVLEVSYRAASISSPARLPQTQGRRTLN